MSIEEALRETLAATVRECLRALLREELAVALPEALRSVGAGSVDSGPRDSLLSVAEAASMLSVTKPTVRDWIKRGYVRALPLGPEGRRYGIRRSDLAAALEAGRGHRASVDIDDEATKIVQAARGRRSKVQRPT